MSENETHDDNDPIDAQVGEILQAWQERRERGVAEDAAQLIARHPELAPRLGECIESVELLSRSGLEADSWDTPVYPSIADFEIVGQLGRGGMGIVYEARQLSLDRSVALKILPLATVSPLAATRFQREAETAAALHHTHIVPIFAVGQNEGVHWYAMQQINGQPLSSLLDTNRGGVDVDEVARIGIQAADALAHAHHHGVVHRDIKPGNLLIEPEGHVWLTDFGLARRDIDATATVTGAMLGTPRYMSPEQVFTSAAANLDHRSDIYSLGATLYELATGVALFDGPTPLDVLQQIRMADPASPRKVRPVIPRDLEVVLQKCLQKDPKDRYQSADQLAADLRAVREGRPIKARGVPLWTIARRRLQRNHDRVVLAASMIAATIALLVGGFAVWKNHEQSTKGMVRIAAAGGPFAASIYPVDSSGASQPPIMTTTVPMQEPIELEQGEYQIRLASSGRHSEFARFGVSASELTHARYVDRRDQADGIEIAKDARLVLIRASDGTDLLAVCDDSELAVYGRGEQLIIRVNTNQINPTGKDQEAVDFSHRATGLAGNRDAQDPYYAKQWPLMRSAIDLTGDEKDEFVITAQSIPALAAISRNGEVVWTAQIELPEPSQQPPPMRVNRNRPPPELPSIMEVIPTEDLDGDRIRDLIVNLVRIIPATAVEPFIASVSGKTGETIAIASLPIQTIGAQRRLWPTDGILFHLPIGKESREYRNFDSVGRQNVQRSTMTWDHQVSGAGTSNLHKLAVTPPLSVTHDDGEPVAVAITDKSVAAWSLKTGKQVGETVDLTFNIASKPLAVRIGNDQPPAFLVWASVGRNLTDSSERPLALVVLGEKKPRWVISTKLHWDIYASGLERSDLPIASDLDGDGVDELLIAERDSERWAASGTIVCLDAATGEMKWPRRVELESVESMAERAAVLRDFDGDGVRDLAVVTLNGRRSSDQLWGNLAEHANYAVYVDLLSGADGRRLGWWREPFSTPNIVKNVLDIDRLCSDGDTKLEATVVVGQLDELRLEATTVRFDLSSEEPPEISRGLDRLGFRDSRVDLGFYRRRPGVDGFYENRVHWIERHSEAELRMDAEWVLANWNTHRGAGRLLLDDTTHSIVRAVDAKTGRVLWSYRHGGFGSNAVPIVDATGNAEQLLLQSRQGGDVTTVLLDAEKGTPRGTLEQRNGIGRLANAYVCDDTNDRTFWLITNATFSTSGLLASGKQGMRLSKISALTGEIIWQTRFLIGLGPGSGGLPPLVSVLRIDCDNDGVLDAVVPDEGEETSVSLAAISGVDGKKLWNHDVKLQIDRWSSEHPWPLMDACGPEQDRRIVLMDMETPMSVGLRMLAARGGIDIDQRVLQLDRDHSRSGSYLFTGNHRLRLNRVDATSEWPRYAVAYPTRPAASSSMLQAWTQFGTSTDGFLDDKARDETQILSDGSEWFLADTSGDGSMEYFKLSGGKLKCSSGDQTVWQVDVPEIESLDRCFNRARHSSIAGVFKHDGSYALVDLRDGHELCSSLTSEKDVNPLQIQGVRTPLVQLVEDGLCLVRVTREGVLSLHVIPASVSNQSSNEVAESVPLIMSPKARSSFDPRRIVRHPSSPLWGGKTATSMFGAMAFGALQALLAFLLPLFYIVHMIKRRRFNLSYLMLAPVIAILALFTWRQLLDPTRMLSADPDVREPWPLILFGGTILIAGGVLLLRAIQQRRYLLLCIMFTVASCMTTAVFLLPMLGQMVVDNGKRYQLGIADVGIVLSLCLLNVVVMGTPFLFLLDWLRKRQSIRSSTPHLEPRN